MATSTTLADLLNTTASGSEEMTNEAAVVAAIRNEIWAVRNGSECTPSLTRLSKLTDQGVKT